MIGYLLRENCSIFVATHVITRHYIVLKILNEEKIL